MTTKPDKVQISAWRLFLTAHTTLIELIERELAQAGLPPLAWYDVLWALKEAPENKLRMNELAQAVLLSRSNLTRLVDRLEAAHLLSREPCPTDRRGAFAVLTSKGLDMLRQMWPVYARCIGEYFARHLRDTEVNVLTEIFQRVITAARDHRPEPD